jgi:uncharacterized protein YutE (UPF0331/DUF86 family)
MKFQSLVLSARETILGDRPVEQRLDVGHHLLAGRGHRVPAAYRDVVPALVEHGILARELGERLRGIAGMRNILVHDYLDVDAAQIWWVIDERLDDLREVHANLAALPELGRPA